MRTLEDNTLEEDEDGDPIIKSARDNNFNAEIDIGKLMKIIPGKNSSLILILRAY